MEWRISSLHFTSLLVTLSSSSNINNTHPTNSNLSPAPLLLYSHQMALNSLSLSFLFLLCFLQLSDGFNAADKSPFHASSSFQQITSRKLLLLLGNLDGKGGKEVVWELRAAPLGPDPLHHHGADPKKPRTP